MTVFPFYVEVESSTRKNVTGVGVRSKNGTLTTKVYQRENGAITIPYVINQYPVMVDDIQCLCTEILYQGDVIHKHITQY